MSDFYCAPNAQRFNVKLITTGFTATGAFRYAQDLHRYRSRTAASISADAGVHHRERQRAVVNPRISGIQRVCTHNLNHHRDTKRTDVQRVVNRRAGFSVTDLRIKHQGISDRVDEGCFDRGIGFEHKQLYAAAGAATLLQRKQENR